MCSLPCLQGREHICRARSSHGFGWRLALLLLCPALDPASTNSARRTRAALPGPLCGGEVGATGPEGGIDMDVDSFSPAQGCAVEKPDLTSRTFWAGRPESAARGGLLFWLLFSWWPRKRKVTRPPQEDETLLSSKTNQPNSKARASRLKSLPQGPQEKQGRWAPAFAATVAHTACAGSFSKSRKRALSKTMVLRRAATKATFVLV
jgi:hypothetical protein